MRNGPYILVIAPDEYSGKKYRNRYCYEHHLVYWLKYGVIPASGEVIHHINHIKTDNRIENLQLTTASSHSKYHARKKMFVDLVCGGCSKRVVRDCRQVRSKMAAGRTVFYCTRRCATLKQWGDKRSSGVA